MTSDSRLSAANNFTTTTHQSVPEQLNPDLTSFPTNFTICIIGAGQGIGEHIAYSYARARAANIILAARSLIDLEKVYQNIKNINNGTNVEYHACDIASSSSVSELADFVRSKFGRIDVLICNAGYAGPVTLKIHEGEPEWVQRAFDVNALGTYHAAHHFIPLLLDSPGGAKAFFAIGSLASLIRRGSIANTGYCVSKMAQVRLVEMLAEQYQDQGLVPITIHPGAVMTRMAEGNTPEAFLPYLVDDVGLCGAVCVWLSSHLVDLTWLGGRFISANWDMTEMCQKKDKIIEKDLLKLTMVIS